MPIFVRYAYFVAANGYAFDMNAYFCVLCRRKIADLRPRARRRALASATVTLSTPKNSEGRAQIGGGVPLAGTDVGAVASVI